SIINLAGIARTDVAVGTESEASILATTRAPTPRIGSSVAASGVERVGIGFATACAGIDCVEGFCCTTGCTTGCTAGATGAEVAAGELTEIFGGVTGFGVGGVPPRGAPASAVELEFWELF
ncbi:MAG: hypothetical protein RL560_560, partial [Actinomycetota bacterium]